MSKVAEAYMESRKKLTLLTEDVIKLAELEEQLVESSEEEKCRLLGISCSYGICSECKLTERRL